MSYAAYLPRPVVQVRPDGVTQAWYAFRDVRASRRAVEWLDDNSLVDHDVVKRFLDEHPEPAIP